MLPFLKKPPDPTSTTAADGSSELEHINQELYKKGAELAEKNKTLLILRKIDEIILSSITDSIEITRRVTSLLVTETEFLVAEIFSYKKKKEKLERLAIYEASKVFETNMKNSSEQFFLSEIPIADSDNIVVQSIKERISKSSNTLQNSLWSGAESAKAQTAQQEAGIKSVFAYPLIVRNQLIGSMVIALADEEQNVSDYTKDLLDRLVQVIGIAIDNAYLYNKLQDANEKLKALDKLKDEFVSLASHELRTPMTAVKSYLWMTLQGDVGVLNDTQKLYLNRAYSSVGRLIKLVNDMLNISRIESGRLTLEMKKVDLAQLVQEVVDEVGPRSEEFGVNVYVSPTTLNPEVIADSDKIKEVLFNLIGNSLKFTPKDGNITISFTQKDDFIETKVKDTGAGISKENLSKLFQKFSMLPDSYSNNKTASGTGLGLYVSKSIVELHKGRIWVESEGLGKGAEFIFSLKVFSDKAFSEFTAGQNQEKKENVGIVHTKV